MSRELCPYEINIKCGYVETRKDGTKFCSQDMNCEASNKWLEEHDSELLDKVAEKFVAWDSKVKGIREDGVCFFTIENILNGIEDLKKEVSK